MFLVYSPSSKLLDSAKLNAGLNYWTGLATVFGDLIRKTRYCHTHQAATGRKLYGVWRWMTVLTS